MAVAALAPFIIGTLNDAAKQSADDMINGLVSELKAKQPQVDQAAQAQAQAIEQIFLQMGSDLANQIETILLSIFDPARYQAYLSMGEQNGPAVPTGPDPQGSSHGSGGKHGMPGHAKGIVNSPHGHLSVTGEEGRELTWIPQGGSVFPHDITEMIMSLISNPIPIPVPSGMSSGSSSGDTQALLSEQRKTNALLQAILEASGNNASSGDIHVHGIADMQSLWQSLNKTGGFQWEYGNRGAGW